MKGKKKAPERGASSDDSPGRDGGGNSAIHVLRGDGQINHRVADAAMPEPLLDHLDWYPGVGQVGAQGVFQSVRVTFGRW